MGIFGSVRSGLQRGESRAGAPVPDLPRDADSPVHEPDRRGTVTGPAGAHRTGTDQREGTPTQITAGTLTFTAHPRDWWIAEGLRARYTVRPVTGGWWGLFSACADGLSLLDIPAHGARFRDRDDAMNYAALLDIQRPAGEMSGS